MQSERVNAIDKASGSRCLTERTAGSVAVESGWCELRHHSQRRHRATVSTIQSDVDGWIFVEIEHREDIESSSAERLWWHGWFFC